MRAATIRRVARAWMMACLVAGCAHPQTGVRRFPDAPVGWREVDDRTLAKDPRPTDTLLATRGIGDIVVRDTSRALGLDEAGPAADVNARDEVPCSTWYCPRNHLGPLPPEAIRRGTAIGDAPVLPLRVVKRKKMGVTPGFIALDARGRKYNVKLDPVDHPRLMSGAEVVCSRLLWAAGWHTAANFPLVFTREELSLDPGAKMTEEELEKVLARGARDEGGRFVGLAVAWLPGDALGGFDTMGRRQDDPNDRIPHERRRSLRATYVLFAWLNLHDADVSNWLDTVVEEDGRRYVRHWFLDFGGGLGASNTRPKPTQYGSEGLYDAPRTLRALAGLGLWRRPWQNRRGAHDRMVEEHPSVGWIAVDGWDPGEFRTGVPVAAQRRLTAADAYWGAKVVASFSDEQIAAAVDAAGWAPGDRALVIDALRRRRDAIARKWLASFTALENPHITADGDSLCWDDLALEKKLAARIGYEVRVDGGPPRWLQPSAETRSCVALGASPAYRVVTVRAKVGDDWARPVDVHVGWSARGREVAVLGVDRERRLASSDGSSSSALAVVGKPVTSVARFVEAGRLFDRARDAMTWQGGRITIRPSAHWDSGFLPTFGARLKVRPQADLGVTTLGPAATMATLRMKPFAPLTFENRFERREDALFAGIGAIGASRWSRYTATRGVSRLSLRQPWGPFTFGVGAGVDVADYDTGDGMLGDPAINEVYALGQVPRFDNGLHLLKALGGIRLDTRTGRHGGGVMVDTAGMLATGFAGDDSSHGALGLTLRGTIPLNDRSFVLSARTMLVEPFGTAEIPFEELSTPGGADGLRASPRGRLRGASSVVGTIEYRWLIHPRLDAAVFVDEGGAWSERYAGIRADRLHTSVGLSLIGWGQEKGVDELDGGASLAWSPDDGLHLLLTVIE